MQTAHSTHKLFAPHTEPSSCQTPSHTQPPCEAGGSSAAMLTFPVKSMALPIVTAVEAAPDEGLGAAATIVVAGDLRTHEKDRAGKRVHCTRR